MTLLETFFPEFYVDSTSAQYNVIQSNDSEIVLELNVTGVSEDDINIEAMGNKLKITTKVSDDRKYLYKGINKQSFSRTFALREDILVKSASAKNGLLCIVLEMKIPEEKKPRKILLTH